MEKLNVCLINDSFPPAIDGVANAVVNYGKVISSGLGHPTVVTPAYPDADDSVYPFPVIRYPSIDMTKAVGYRAGLPFSADVMRQVEKADLDIIHSHCPITSTLFARTLRERIDVPLVMTYHTKFDIDIANAIKSRILQTEAARLLVENISACDEVWTVSRGAGDNLRKLGYTGEYSVVPNGVDFPKGLVPEKVIREVTSGYDLPPEVPVFLFVGRMMWYKGIRIILDALAGLAAEGTDFRMVFVGGGGDREEIIRYTEELGLENRVFFVEPIRDRERIRAWYCRADLFLFPSTFDTNGLVVHEAAACSLASVLIRGSCAAEDVADGQNGFLIDENAESMRVMLKTLCGDRERMKAVGCRAENELYISWEDAVKNAYSLYGNVIEKYRSGGYPAHRTPEDGMFRWASETLESVSRRKEFLRYVQEGFLQEQEYFHAQSEADTERVKRAIEEKRAQLLSELEESQNRVRSGIEETRTVLKEKLDDITQFFDRYL
ncbi:MAG: glycosyltransferase [Oscillospiraceae bacterium]|nr:glycosyltransferase [Oscillospiraceae bacterium]